MTTKPASEQISERTAKIREQQRSGGGEVTAVMVSGRPNDPDKLPDKDDSERVRVKPLPSSPTVGPDGEFWPMERRGKWISKEREL